MESSSPEPQVSREGALAEPRVGTVPAPRERRDIVRWPAVVAGVLVTITTLVVLSVLGLAIGLSGIEPTGQAVTAAGTGAVIWSIATGAVAFFLGGFVAARAGAVGGQEAGAFNGFMVGVSGIALAVLFVGVGVGNLLGAATANLGRVTGVDLGQADVSRIFETAKEGAWGTLIGLVLALALAALGGWVGHRGATAGRTDRA